MCLQASSPPRRSGFTLVELIVVITIISILAALTTAAVHKAYTSVENTKTALEIRHLESGIDGFKSRFGVGYLPSQFRVRNRMSDYFLAAADALDVTSRNYLTQMFPRIDTKNINLNQGWVLNNGGTASGALTDKVVLNGAECLVFFLGGPNGLDGFSDNPTKPYTFGQRGNLSYTFESKRLKQNLMNTLAYSYLDAFAEGTTGDQPYYYFTSGKTGDYNPAEAISFSGGLVAPFRNANGRFPNPNSFQIISAGKDKFIGLHVVTPASPVNTGYVVWDQGRFTATQPAEAYDNIANFYEKRLGTP